MLEAQPPPPSGAGAKRPRLISVQFRITLMLAVTAAAFICLLMLIQGGWGRQVDLLLHDRVEETDRVLRRVIALRANGARLHADDYTRWDDLVNFARERNPHWGDVYITQSITTFSLDFAWVLDEQFNVIFTANPGNDPSGAPLLVPAPALAAALRAAPIRHFFVRTPRGLLEIWTSPIQPSDDFERKTRIHGYYVIGRLWTPARIADLGRDGNGRARLVLGETPPPPSTVSAHTGMISVAVPLPGIDGSPVATVLFETTLPMVSQVYDTLRISALLNFAGVLVIILAIGWALSHWVSHPIATITEALHQQNPTILASSAQRQDELGRLARLVEEFFVQRERLIEAREAATQATAAKSQFLANISHELRTPMHGILSYSRFGLKGAMSAPREQLLDDFKNIESCGTSLLSLLDDLLDLAKFEAGRMRLEFAPTALEEIVADAVDEFASAYHEKGLRAEICAENTLEPAVVDRRRILQVMRNLLSNAGKFSAAGGIVRVRIATSAGRARVVVEDSGTGIPASEVELIFENFEQASNAKAQSGGTGLGLAICREILEAHGGRIWAENRPEGGASIIFELPLEGPPVADEQDVLQTNRGHEQISLITRSRATPDPEGRTAA
jgi:signal transduction histidine kinase